MSAGGYEQGMRELQAWRSGLVGHTTMVLTVHMTLNGKWEGVWNRDLLQRARIDPLIRMRVAGIIRELPRQMERILKEIGGEVRARGTRKVAH